MRSRISFFVLLFVVSSLVLPAFAHAGGIPFFGPIIPQGDNQAVCPAGFGMLMEVINNIISFALTVVIVFVAPLMIAYSGFLFVVNPVNSSGKEEAKSVLKNTVVGIVVALASWMIVDAIMAVLYQPSNPSEVWSNLVNSGSSPACLPQKGALPGEVLAPTVTAPGIEVTPSVPEVAPGQFTFDPGISAQVPSESGALSSLLSCMVARVPSGVGRISSISDSLITSGARSFASCAAGGCAHAANSCHYGGRSCVGSSYAVDFGDDKNTQVLSAAATACGANFVGPEDNHLHVSVGASCGCN